MCNSENIEFVKHLELPAYVVAGTIPSNWANHTFWVPQTAIVTQVVEKKGKNPYMILGIQPEATIEEIKNAYHENLKKYHPDRVEHLGFEFRELAGMKAKEITWAYEMILKQYDIKKN